MGRLDPRAGERGDARQDESPARCAPNLRCAANQTEIRRKQFHVLTMGLPFPRRGQQIQCSFGDAIGAVATVAVPKERGDKGCEPSLRTLARFAATTFLVVFIASIFWSFFGRFFISFGAHRRFRCAPRVRMSSCCCGSDYARVCQAAFGQ